MKKKPPKIVTIARFSVLTVALWIGFEVYWTLTKQPDVGVPSEVVAPLSPSLNTEVLDEIQSRLFFEEEEIQEIPLTSPEARTAIPETTPTLEETGEVETETEEETQEEIPEPLEEES